MWLKYLYKKEVVLARLILYVLAPIYYCYILFINTGSCAPGNECVLCGMKTAIWNLIHFDVCGAFKANGLVSIVILLIIIVVIDVLIIIKKKLNKKIFT